MIGVIAANIPIAPRYPVIRATAVRGPPPDLYRSCLEPACIEGTHPTGKGVRRRDLDVAPAIRSEQRSPRLEIHRRCAAKIVALKHYRLRLGPNAVFIDFGNILLWSERVGSRGRGRSRWRAQRGRTRSKE